MFTCGAPVSSFPDQVVRIVNGSAALPLPDSVGPLTRSPTVPWGPNTRVKFDPLCVRSTVTSMPSLPVLRLPVSVFRLLPKNSAAV